MMSPPPSPKPQAPPKSPAPGPQPPAPISGPAFLAQPHFPFALARSPEPEIRTAQQKMRVPIAWFEFDRFFETCRRRIQPVQVQQDASPFRVRPRRSGRVTDSLLEWTKGLRSTPLAKEESPVVDS